MCALLVCLFNIFIMTRNHIILLLLFFGSLSASAKIRTPQEMKRVATSVLSLQTTRGVEAEITCIDNTDTYSIYGNENGFVVISRDDKSDAVLGYSMTPFDINNIPCGLSWWLNAIDVKLQQSSIKLPKCNTRTAPIVVEPMIISKWGQGDPYNAKSPTFNGKKAPTGCVATAISQLMFYYRYPEKAMGVGYYTLGDASHKYSITVNSVYDWDQINASYAGSWFMTDEEKQYISQLNYDAGVASHMNYASDGSGSTAYDAANGLGEIFQFDSLAMKCVSRDYCINDEEWQDIICQEFLKGHPLVMCGQDMTRGGHCFLIDGINEEGLIHVNWGWNGNADGYYNLTDMNPTGILGSSSTMHFNFDQTIVTNLKCHPDPDEGEKYQSCWVLDKEDDFISDQMNGIIVSGPEIIWQHYHLTFYGQLGVRFVDAEGKEVLFVPLFDTAAKNYSPVDGGYGFYMSYFNHITVSDLKELPANTYTAYLASKAIQDEEPQFVCYPGGKHNEFIITKANDGTLTIKKSDTSNITSMRYNPAVPSYIYNLRGRNLGTDANALRKGIYIIDGKKVVK